MWGEKAKCFPRNPAVPSDPSRDDLTLKCHRGGEWSLQPKIAVQPAQDQIDHVQHGLFPFSMVL